MSATDHVRRVVTVLLVAAALLVAPQIASAQFTRSQSASLTVTTGSVPPPPQPSGTYTCDSGSSAESTTFVVNANKPVGDASVLGFRLVSGGTTYAQSNSASSVHTISASQPSVSGQTSWRLEVRRTAGTWVSSPAVVDVTCKNVKTPTAF